MGVKTAQRLVETRFKKPVKALVHEMYYEKGMSQSQIAKKLGVSAGSVHQWMKQWGWPARVLMVAEIPPLAENGQ